MNGPLQDSFTAFLHDPSGATFLAVREKVIAHDDYAPYSKGLEEVVSLIEQERWIDANDAWWKLMPNQLLSPRAHLVGAVIAENSDEEERATFERAVAGACARAILDTGEGTKEEPYVVTRTDDIYDVLQLLGKQVASQALVEDDGRHLDRMSCADGSEAWFDITAPFERLGDLMSGDGPTD